MKTLEPMDSLSDLPDPEAVFHAIKSRAVYYLRVASVNDHLLSEVKSWMYGRRQTVLIRNTIGIAIVRGRDDVLQPYRDKVWKTQGRIAQIEAGMARIHRLFPKKVHHWLEAELTQEIGDGLYDDGPDAPTFQDFLKHKSNGAKGAITATLMDLRRVVTFSQEDELYSFMRDNGLASEQSRRIWPAFIAWRAAHMEEPESEFAW